MKQAAPRLVCLLALCLSAPGAHGARVKPAKAVPAGASLRAPRAALVAPRPALYKNDCFKKRPVFLAEGAGSNASASMVPGAGMEPGSIEPYQVVLKARRASRAWRWASRAWARWSADRAVAKRVEELQAVRGQLAAAEAALDYIVGDAEVAQRLRALLPAFAATLRGVELTWLDKLRRNVALHAEALEIDAAMAGAREPRRAQRGPRLEARRAGVGRAPASLSADAAEFVPGTWEALPLGPSFHVVQDDSLCWGGGAELPAPPPPVVCEWSPAGLPLDPGEGRLFSIDAASLASSGGVDSFAPSRFFFDPADDADDDPLSDYDLRGFAF
ncbi:unnamed protein product [Prorocentrum cordatum]|uniref:Uncharacterized protein n=1 Tax=Prorocentrum cordatum TaxID=2364126 RepID=A0ABN9UKG3_9DINO|nr:unnamed protein product [Polarella glacialis]